MTTQSIPSADLQNHVPELPESDQLLQELFKKSPDALDAYTAEVFLNLKSVREDARHVLVNSASKGTTAPEQNYPGAQPPPINFDPRSMLPRKTHLGFETKENHQ